MDIRTTYLGLNLRSPIVVSACSLSESVDNIVQMEDAGAGAVVMYSLFEEQIRLEDAGLESAMNSTSHVFAEATNFFPDLEDYKGTSAEYLERIYQAKRRVTMPIIGSLNGITPEGWIRYAREIESAGADALEVNIFFIPAEAAFSSAAVEHRYLNIIEEVKRSVKIPVSVKMNPYFSSTANMAQRMRDSGADGLVLFNRFYQPDFNIYSLQIENSLETSSPQEIRLPLLWIALLHGKLDLSLAATTGVHSAREVIKYLLAGADVTMTASALYQYGIAYLKEMQQELETWMQHMGYTQIDDFRGRMSQQQVADPTAFDRANYIQILKSK